MQCFFRPDPWWCHQMETISALLAICAGNSPVPVNSLHKGQCRRALMFSLICAWINDSVNNREADDLKCNPAHYNVNVMLCHTFVTIVLYPISCHIKSYYNKTCLAHVYFHSPKDLSSYFKTPMLRKWYLHFIKVSGITGNISCCNKILFCCCCCYW